MENEIDPLARQLREEALTNRPAFSQELHERLMRDIHAAPTRMTIMRLAGRSAAVAALVTICCLIGMRMLRQEPIPIEKPRAMVTERIETIPTEFEIKGLCSASAWPPEIRIDLPIDLPVAELPEEHAAVTSASEGLPQILLDAMQRQINGADSQLANEIPLGLRSLFVDHHAKEN